MRKSTKVIVIIGAAIQGLIIGGLCIAAFHLILKYW